MRASLFLPIAALVVAALGLACGSSGTSDPQPNPAPPGDPKPSTETRPPAADPTLWTKTGSLAEARYAHTATVLPDKRVIVIGGESADHVMRSSAEIFDPSEGKWSAAPALPAPRSNHAAVALPDGRVLVIGGGKNSPIGQPLGGETVTSSCVLFDPATNTFAPTGSMHHARSHSHAVLLASGKVLAVGGGSDAQEMAKECGGSPYCGPFGKELASAEIYDPATGEWTEAAPMATARNSFSVTPLASGRLLAVGGTTAQGEGFTSTEIYDPVANVWAPGPNLLDPPRQHHSATLLGTGRVLVLGGKNPNISPLASVQLFDPTTSAFESTKNLKSSRTTPGVVTLESGHALVVGGYDQRAQNAGNDPYMADARLYDDTTKKWTDIAPLATGRFGATFTLLGDGSVLVAGGYGVMGELAKCEIARPAEAE